MNSFLFYFKEENKKLFKNIKENFPTTEIDGLNINVEGAKTAKKFIEFIEDNWHEYSRKRIKYDFSVKDGIGNVDQIYDKNDVETTIDFLENYYLKKD